MNKTSKQDKGVSHTSILISGGSASGKSSFAAALAMRLPTPRMVINTAYPDSLDLQRIHWLTQLAGQGFSIITRNTDIGNLNILACGTVLVECLCHLTANEMFDSHGNCNERTTAVINGIRILRARCHSLIVITNEIGADMGIYNEKTHHYTQVLGCINATLAADFDHAYEMVCGIPIVLKGEQL